MSKRPSKLQAVQDLDSRLVAIKSLLTLQRPPPGWVATIRKTLGMTQRQLAARIGAPESRIASIEKGERNGKTTLASLQQAAEAMDCQMVYALVPKQSLEQFLQQQARLIATARIKYVNHHMMLEGQQVPDEALERLIQDTINETLNELPGLLWNKPR